MVLIRPFHASDADALAMLFHAAVHKGGIRDYSIAQVQAWSPSKPDPHNYLRRAEERTVFVAVDDAGLPAGYGDLASNGHIDHLYCRPDLIGTGVGSAIYAAIEKAATHAGIPLLLVEASEGARRFFKHRGFENDARNDFTINGVAIHNYRMSKPIA